MQDQNRQLIAIMFTDITGYTQVMGSDEAYGLRLIELNRALQKPLIKKHGGKFLKEMGDGTMASFGNAYHAVKCAIEIQLSANQDLKNKIRIGIHVGDVTHDGNDVFGDGVNIASRLESVAEAGCIFISESVYNATRSMKDIEAKYIGKLRLKNVSDKIETYAIYIDGVNFPDAKKIKQLLGDKSQSPPFYKSVLFYGLLVSIILLGVWYISKDKPVGSGGNIHSIAVLPFDNFTGDPEQEYFVAGFHDNLITSLSQISSLRIISKTSTLRYSNETQSLKEIADDLGVDAIIEASVLKAGDTIRINVQLIQVYPEEKHIWAQIFDRPYNHNILSLFTEVSQSIVDQINLELTPAQKSGLLASKKIHPEAYKAYLNGKYHLEKLSPEGFKRALNYFEKSIELDAGFAPVYAEMANCYMYQLQMRQIPLNEAIPNIYKYNRKALSIDPDLPEANFTMALINWFEWNWKSSDQAFKKVLLENPNHVLANAFYSHLLMIQNQFDLAIPYIEKAMELDPRNDLVLSLYAVVLIHNGDRVQAKEYVKESLELNPQSILAIRLTESISYLGENYDTSIQMLHKIYSEIFPLDIDIINEYNLNGYTSAVTKLAFKLESNSQGQDVYIAVYFNRAGKHEKAIEWLQKAYEHHDGDIPYIFRATEMNNLKSDPRFIALAKKVNLPI